MLYGASGADLAVVTVDFEENAPQPPHPIGWCTCKAALVKLNKPDFIHLWKCLPNATVTVTCDGSGTAIDFSCV